MIMSRNILYTLTTLLCYVCTAVQAMAQHISTEAPSQVQTGENFRLSYTVNTQDVDDFRAANVPDGLEVIAGPYTSRQSTYQMINGHASSSSSITITYTLYAAKPGTYTIAPATIRINGKTITSKSARIRVTGQATKNGSRPKMHQDDETLFENRPAGSHISGKDLFIKVEANKRRVHEQEPILLTYKVYTQVNLTQLDGNMPDLTGFHTQQVPLPQQKSFHIERVNGRPYRCVTWTQYVMYPQMTGKLTIPSITFKGMVVQENRDVDPFEAFFNGGSGYIEVKRNIQAPSIDIQVDPLPQRPAGFSGGVGKMNISAQISKQEVKAGDPISLRVVIGGKGNLKLVKQPDVQFPKDFDKFDPKVTDKTRLTANGVEGNMVYDFTVVPRHQGKYVIPATTFIYYDTDANAYKTLQTQPFTINVSKGDGDNTTATYSEEQSNDIRDIHRDNVTLEKRNQRFYGSTAYYLWIVTTILIFILLLIVFRHRAIEQADIVKMRGKHANKMARKRLKSASRLMFKGQRNAFYEEVSKALWDYAAYKLNMPAQRLTRDNIAQELTQKGVDSAHVDMYIQAIDECEYARYAPTDEANNMQRTFTQAMEAITEIENVMKKRK